jgi:hypothetical protein
MDKNCKHKWIVDKNKNFAYCEECLCCIKDGKIMTKEEYKLLKQN